MENTNQKVKTPATEDDLWGSKDISVDSSRTSLRNNRLDSSKTNSKIESDNGWGDWNDGGSEGKIQYYLQKWQLYSMLIVYRLRFVLVNELSNLTRNHY